MLFAYFLLGTGWAIFYILHSLLATLWLKEYLQDRLGSSYKYYRLSYNFFFSIFFLVLLIYQASLPSEFLYHSPWFIKFLSVLGILGGLVILILSFVNYNLSEFLGTEQFRNASTVEHKQLVTKGLNSFVRHPIYFGTLMLMLGYLFIAFSTKNLLFFTFFLIYLLVGTYIEERKLILAYGEEYRAYQKKVKMLIPYIF